MWRCCHHKVVQLFPLGWEGWSILDQTLHTAHTPPVVLWSPWNVSKDIKETLNSKICNLVFDMKHHLKGWYHPNSGRARGSLEGL